MCCRSAMKIFYIAMKYDYGKKERGLSFEYYNFYDTLLKMNGGEHEVIYFPFDELMEAKGKDKMNELLLKSIYETKPELCFFFLFTDEIKKETIQEITEKSGAITLNWFADDHWRFDIYSKYWAPYFSWIATTDSSAPTRYYKIGVKNVIKTQWACNHFLYKPIKISKVYDVTFIGQAHGNRKQVVSKIKHSGIDIQCWGTGWSNGRLSQEKMIQTFSASKINLNLTNPSTRNLSQIASLFLKRKRYFIVPRGPREIIDKIKAFIYGTREQIKGRNFEVPGCGAFLLTSDADNLTDYYEDGKEIVIYKNDEDLLEKINYYLKHDKERELIAEKGLRRTLAEHTYEKRFNFIFKAIGLIK